MKQNNYVGQGEIPERIFLQWHGDSDPDTEESEVCFADVTWSADRVYDTDIEFVRINARAVGDSPGQRIVESGGSE